jgi:hypothetical protein
MMTLTFGTVRESYQKLRKIQGEYLGREGFGVAWAINSLAQAAISMVNFDI